VRSRFGDFVLDLSQRQLLRDRQGVHLTPKAFELLSLLLERAPAAISKDEIVRAVWAGGDVTDASLTNVVAEIRAALGDDARQSRFVRTVQAFGYAFCADVVRETPDAASGACYLVVTGRRLALAAGASVVGRDPAAEVFLDHTSVSRRHARVLLSTDGATIEDLGSRNGTFVNGRPVKGPVPLGDGDVITLGSLTVVVEAPVRAESTESLSVDPGEIDRLSH
jgi:DNA-binding winged helix-turn-helix (wHTH) protein